MIRKKTKIPSSNPRILSKKAKNVIWVIYLERIAFNIIKKLNISKNKKTNDRKSIIRVFPLKYF